VVAMENQKECRLDEFLKEQTPATAYNFVLTCRDYILNVCKTWREPNLSERDKIRELACEIFLILLESFDASKVARRESLLSYIHYRLKQVVKPRGRGILAFDEGAPGAGSFGRYNFTSEKLDITEFVYGCVRKALLEEVDEDCALLVFLFVHVYPQAFWASRQLIGPNIELNATLIERYRKKLQRFNGRLRRSIELNADFDWKDIFNWSRGERSHLAWRLICVSPNEVEAGLGKELDIVNKWRETVQREGHGDFEQKQAAKRILSSMRKQWEIGASVFSKSRHVAFEDVEGWGTPRDMLDIFLGLEEQDTSLSVVSERFTGGLYNPDATRDTFSDVVKELADWFEKLKRSKA
jgi:hypothetical protein